MTIKPAKGKIYLGMQNIQKIGDLDVSTKKTIREVAIVEAIGDGVTSVKVGDTVLVKAWAIDTVTYEKQDYFFVSESSDGVCAVIEK
jgi:co-chaperonin GroES (HSP10)